MNYSVAFETEGPELRWTGLKLITLDSLINITLSWGNANSHIDFYA